MHQMTKEAIQKILTETGRALHVEDYDDIEALDKIAAKVINQTPEERRLLNQPFELCGILFYPLTVAKSLWYAEKCEEWGVEGDDQDMLLFWLLTVKNEPDALDQYAAKKDAQKEIRKMSRRLVCPAEDLLSVCGKCLGITFTEKKSAGAKKATNYGAVISILLREYGGTPDMWLYESSVDMIASLFAAYSEKINAERNTPRQPRSKRAVAPAPTPKMIALSEFREMTHAIREKWKGQENG